VWSEAGVGELRRKRCGVVCGRRVLKVVRESWWAAGIGGEEFSVWDSGHRRNWEKLGE